MAAQPIDDDKLLWALELKQQHGSTSEAARAAEVPRTTFQHWEKLAAERGLSGFGPVMPGFAVKTVSSRSADGAWVKQGKEHGPVFEQPETHVLGKITVNRDADGRIIQDWTRYEPDKLAQEAAQKAALEGFKDQIPKAPLVQPPALSMSHMLSQYTVTDAHLGALAWNAETGAGDYDLAIGEKLLVDWFSAAIAGAPPSQRAVFAQLGDFLHYDSFKSITPEHGHHLDADSRYPKMVRAAIRVVRKVTAMLLEKHAEVHLIMSDANHDPVGGTWLREMFSVLYEDEPRLTVDTSPGTYNVVEHGDVSLFYHHGHRRGTKNVDSMAVGRFRQIYGRTRFSYVHVGHKHADELKSTDLMKVEQHETLAAPDAFGSNWISGRSAKRIDYHARRGEVGRNTITAEMVMEFAA